MATMASAVGMAAMRIWPARPCRSASISWRMARVSPTMRRAQSSTRSPSGVKPWKRDPRCTSSTPNESSSCLMPAESVGWLTPQASAAWPKCRSRASAMMNSSLSIMPPCQRGPTPHHRNKTGRSAIARPASFYAAPVSLRQRVNALHGPSSWRENPDGRTCRRRSPSETRASNPDLRFHRAPRRARRRRLRGRRRWR